MQVYHGQHHSLIRIDRGEQVFSQLEQVAAEKGWQSAQVSGIGAVSQIEIGAYHLEDKIYTKFQFDGIHELINMQGNLSIKDGKPFFHLHGTISDHSLVAKGGHFFSMRSEVLVECVIHPFPHRIEREYVDSLGLAQWKFCPHTEQG